MNRSRRNLLAAGGSIAALSATTLAGCLDFAAGDGAQGPDGTPGTLSCAEEGFVRLDAPIEEPVAERTLDVDGASVELSIEGTSETYGNSLRIALRNAGDEPIVTRGEYAYALQRETEAGWEDVRGSPSGGPIELPVDEESFASNASYGWDLTLREGALAEAVPGVDLIVCPALGPGTHRFVYWGLVDAPPVGIEFELVG